VPTDYSFGCDDEEGLLPNRTGSPGDYPKELIDEVEARARMSTLQRDELLTQSGILEKETPPPAKEALSLAKMLLGANPFEISKIQEAETEAELTTWTEM
jgi:hypothetical protein